MKPRGHYAESAVDDLCASFAARAKHWLRCEAPWFLASLTGHVVVLLALLLVLGRIIAPKQPSAEEASLEAASVEPPPAAELVAHLVVEPTPIDDPPPLDPNLTPPDAPLDLRANSTNSPMGSAGDVGGDLTIGPPGGSLHGGTFNVPSMRIGMLEKGPGPSGEVAGGIPKDKRGAGRATGMTPQSERAVAGALFWLVRHQLPDGSWSLRDFDKRCTDKTCTGQGTAESDTGATALGLLPLLAAGQTHLSKGPYQANVHKALYYLMSVQGKDGDFKGSSKGNAHMYAHALCAIALCEAYDLSQDKAVARAAQSAIDFIVAAQNAGTGGWRYQPGQDGDTSVVAWQVMALKSAQMAYLNVPKSAFDGAEKWLKSCAHGNYGEQFSYQPGGAATQSMSAAGLLCGQYLHLKRGDAQMRGGIDYLLARLPNSGQRDSYYWYYATQVMHNVPGPEWDAWNRATRKLLIDTQAKEGCAAGSWDPSRPAQDRWGQVGGRLLVTSLSCLTLEVYYRRLPLFKFDNRDALNDGAK